MNSRAKMSNRIKQDIKNKDSTKQNEKGHLTEKEIQRLEIEAQTKAFLESGRSIHVVEGFTENHGYKNRNKDKATRIVPDSI